MKRLFHLALALLCIAALFSSCEKAPFVTMTGPRSYTFTRGGGTQTFAFSCNRDWSVSSSESWIRITPSSGKASDGDITVTITCSPNTTYDPRTATVTLKVEELTETISVTQNTGLGLIVSPTTLELTNAAQNIEVEVQKNVQYTVAIDEAGADWIKQGGTKALTTDKVTFRIEANTSYDNREGLITFKQTDGDLTETVSVRQSQTNGLFITTPEYNLSNKEHNLSVEVKANVAFEVASQSDWIEITETKALVPSTVMLSVKANESYDNRTGTVLVKQTNGDLTGIITINQKQTDYLTVTPNSKEVTSAEQTIDVDVTDNVSYSVVIPDDAKSWISVVSNTQSKALIDDKVILAIAQNLSYDSRTASVTIKQKDGPLAETVEIKQAQGDGLFVTTPEYTLSNEAHTVSVELKANVEFEVSSEVDWIACVDTKALSTSTVTLSVAANERYDDRTGKVKIKQKNGALEETVTINQKQTDYLSVSPTSFDVSNTEGTVTIEVKDNVSYSVVIPDDAKEWISVQSNTQTKALVDDKVVLAIAKNSTYDNREASVTIKQVDGSLAGTVAIKQAYGEGLIVEKAEYEIGQEGGVIEVDVNSNVEYGVTSNIDWIHYAETKALSSSTIILNVDENSLYSKRTGTVTIKKKDGSLSTTISVKQAEKIAVTSVDIDKTELFLDVDKTAVLTATISPSNATVQSVTWVSSNEGILEIDESGKILALKKGKTTITAKAENKEVSCNVYVNCIPDDEIWYTTIDDKPLTFQPYNWGSMPEIISNTYSDGKVRMRLKSAPIEFTERAFADQYNLKTIILPETVRALGWGAFNECNNLESVFLPDTLKVIGVKAFGVCESLKEITLPDSVESIAEGVFSGCTSLSKITSKLVEDDERTIVMDGVLVAVAWAGLSSYTVPEGVIRIGREVFSHFSHMGSTTLKTVTLPSTLKSIGDYAFQESPITSIIIPDSVEKIESAAFCFCSNLASAALPAGLKKVEDNVFDGCLSLGVITLPTQLEHIGSNSFSGTALKTIIIPGAVVFIGHHAFSECNSLESIYLRPLTPPALETYYSYSDPFIYTSCPIYVPSAALTAYQSAEVWKDYYLSRLQPYSE